MGCSSSKHGVLKPKPHNPLQELQYKEARREYNRRKKECEKKKIFRLQEKNNRNILKNNRKRSFTSSKADLHQSTLRDITQRPNDFNLNSNNCSGKYVNNNSEIENKLQAQLEEDLSLFLSNQIISSVQFFQNFESELTNIGDALLAIERDLKENLLDHSVLLTNSLDAIIGNWITFKPLHGPGKNSSQLLQTPTMYVVFEDIDVVQQNDANYDSISPQCTVSMECDFRETIPINEDYTEMLDDIRWKGYVRLRLRDISFFQRQRQNLNEEIYDACSSGYSSTSGYTNKTCSSSICEEYDYAYITELNRHRPLKDLKTYDLPTKQQADSSILPEYCFSKLENFVELKRGSYDDNSISDEENFSDTAKYGQDLYSAQKIIKHRTVQEVDQYYLNSKEFLRYFVQLLRKKLAIQLHIDHEELNMATYRGCSVYTRRYEIIPAIYIAHSAQGWPRCAFEFRFRNRPVSINRRTGDAIQWPTVIMIKRLETFGFHIIPEGCTSKTSRNPFRDIEWKIIFPKAERYLEEHLSNAQVKVFMIIKALIKSFVEPLEKCESLLFALGHIRVHLFWECELDYYAWPEEFLGEVLLRFIGSFMNRLREKCLRDYFVCNRNLFESIPEYSLITLYSILADIVGNPLMHLMIALRNVEFGQDFFPKLNYNRFYYNLIETDIMKLKKISKKSGDLISVVDIDHKQPEGCQHVLCMNEVSWLIDGPKEMKKKDRAVDVEKKKPDTKNCSISLLRPALEIRRQSVDSIDREFFIKSTFESRSQNAGIENLRRTNILEILINHHLAMSKKAIDYHSFSVANYYLVQARVLCQYYHNYGCDVGAKTFLSSANFLEEKLEALKGKRRKYFKASNSVIQQGRAISPERKSNPYDELQIATTSSDAFKFCYNYAFFKRTPMNEKSEVNPICSLHSESGRKSIKFDDDVKVRHGFLKTSQKDKTSDILQTERICKVNTSSIISGKECKSDFLHEYFSIPLQRSLCKERNPNVFLEKVLATGVKEIFKQKTLQIKEALTQSSDT